MSNGFSIGSAALKSVSSAIEVTSKNIAAANVNGYKFKEYLFQESISRSQLSDVPGRFAPLVGPGFERRNFASGKLQDSNSPLDMAIFGDGFFTVGLLEQPNAQKTYYTRASNFTPDQDGFIRTSSGLYLYGYKATSDGKNINNEQVGALKVPTSDMLPKQTSLGVLALNFDARNDLVRATSQLGTAVIPNNIDPEIPDSYSHVYGFSLFDETGQEHAVSLYFRRVTPNLYDAYVNIDGQRWGTGDATGDEPLTIQMPNQGTAAQLPSEVRPVARFGFNNGQLVVVGSTELTETELVELSNDSETENLTLNFNIEPPTSAPLGAATVFTTPSKFSLDFSGSTHIAKAFSSDVTQDGFGSGSWKSLSIDSDGILRAEFTNKQTLILGQCQLASFKGLNGLKEVANNTYRTSTESGDPFYAKPGERGLGEIRHQFVELSNVNLTDELVKLVVLQQSYQSNAQSIRAQSESISAAVDATR